MEKHYFVALYRAFFGVLAIVAIVAQCLIAADKPTFSFANFFSYFTIESNVLAAIILLLSAWGAWVQRRNNTFALIRGAAVLYMATTGIVYVLLLSNVDVQTTGWVNIVLHYIMPIVLLVDWLLDPPRRRIRFLLAMSWLVFPMAYLAYSLARGASTGWYPYPFLNPATGGYAKVAVMCLVVALVLLGLTWLIARHTRPQIPRPK